MIKDILPFSLWIYVLFQRALTIGCTLFNQKILILMSLIFQNQESLKINYQWLIETFLIQIMCSSVVGTSVYIG